MPKKDGASELIKNLNIGRSKVKKSSRKVGRNAVKCARYRSRVGKPLGRGVAGNKRGKNKVTTT